MAEKYDREDGVIAVTGAASGLGKLICENLRYVGFVVLGIDKSQSTKTFQADVADINTLPDCPDNLVGIVNCAGINGNEWFEDVTGEHFGEIMGVNAGGIVVMGQWALEALKANQGTILNIVSNASHMPMTASLAYNASKAAAHIITQQMARELTKKYGITSFGISPNKLAGTGMSLEIEANVLRTRGWTSEFAKQYQLNAMLTGEETDPIQLAEFIGFLLTKKERHKALSGCVLPYGA